MSQANSNFDDSGFDTSFGSPNEPPMQVPVPKPVYRKPEFNIYSLLLILSFLNLLVAAILFFLEVDRFE